MLLFRVFKVIKSQKFKCKNKCFLNTQAALDEDVKAIKRKFLKQLSSQKLQPWKKCNLYNLFAGTIDKKIFEYPSVISDEALDTVLNQSAAVESFFNLNQNSKLTDDILQELKKLELFGLSVPQKFGGAGYSETETKYLMECTGCNPTIARFLGYTEDFGCRIISLYGTEEQKNKYLPDLAEGKRFMTMAYLENDPIIDLSKQEGMAILNVENNEYNLIAEKKWVHYANKADLFLVMVKSATILDESELQLKLNMFIVENNMPGVTVHKLKSQWAEKASIFEVSFKDVPVPLNNILGDQNTNGFDILKYALSHSNLTDATLCLSLMKRMLYDALRFVEKKGLKDIRLRGHLHVKENIATIISYIYALESVIYLLTGSLDMYEKPDLFNDAIMAKVLAVDFLQLAIQTYTEIIGYESFKKSGIIEEALDALQYHSVFDENIEYFKLMSAAEGLIFASTKLSKKIRILKNPYDNPYDVLKLRALRNWQAKKFKSELKLKMELHASLSTAADIVEENLVKLQFIIEKLFVEYGSLAIYCEHAVIKLAEIASYLFAAIACLSRASSSVCYDVNNCSNESLVAHVFTKMIDIKIQKLYEEELMFSEALEYYRSIGKNVFSYKEYPMQHPLSRVI